MALTILWIWIGSLGIGIVGAAAASKDHWVRVLGLNVVAGVYSIAIFGSLRGEFGASLFRAGDAYVWLTMSSLVVMWGILAVGATLAMWTRRRRLGTARGVHYPG